MQPSGPPRRCDSNQDVSRKLGAIHLAIGFVISLVLNAFLAYAVLDQGVTISHIQDARTWTESDLRRLAELIPGNGITKQQLIRRLKEIDSNEVVSDEGCFVGSGGLRFMLNQNGAITNVITEAQYKPDPNCDSIMNDKNIPPQNRTE